MLSREPSGDSDDAPMTRNLQFRCVACNNPERASVGQGDKSLYV